ncbi:hypothetical protein GCK72_023176 [Caenorhabditis remanei]|uniref:Uncharacterized protein n=1 Tax=Caenorhabditis remanei TaxID=31234 RepID=A0A6A5FWD3_CAERE|nr:hypothetical protein GCK72_023176 [Caenorhabditis remanei]KAF1746719.1 hypothetical protein GCK72_023176 [Caenorhabditis remanei]
MITAIIILAVIGLTSSLEEMTHEEKRIENALFAMVGEEPPNQDVPMDHNDQALHDLLLTSAREVSVGHDGGGAADVGKNKEHSVGNDARLCQNDDPTNKSPGGVMAEMWFQSGFEKVVLSKFWNINDQSAFSVILGSAFGNWLFSAFCKIKSSKEADLITSNTCQH